MRKYNLICLLILFLSCRNNEKNSVEFSVTTHKVEQKKDSIIRKSIYDYINKNSDKDIFKAYFHILENKDKCIKLYDSNFFIGFVKDSISIGFSNKQVQLSPLPISYSIEEGKKGEYLIFDKENRRLKTFILNFLISRDLKVNEVYLSTSYEGENREGYIKEKIYLDDMFKFDSNWKYRMRE